MNNIIDVAATAYKIITKSKRYYKAKSKRSKKSNRNEKRGTENPWDREIITKQVGGELKQEDEEKENKQQYSHHHHQKETLCVWHDGMERDGRKHTKTYYFETRSIWYIKVDACSSNVTFFHILHSVLHIFLNFFSYFGAFVGQLYHIFLYRNICNNYFAGWILSW